MIITIIIGIILLAIAIYLGFKVLKNIFLGAIVLVLILTSSFLIFGSIQIYTKIPFIGQYFPENPTPESIIVSIKDIFYNIDVIDVNRDSEQNLLIAIANTGKFEASNIRIFVDNQTTGIINTPKDPLKSGEMTIIQTNWNTDFSEILVQTTKVNATYKLK